VLLSVGAVQFLQQQPILNMNASGAMAIIDNSDR
jgi:hypothetical protein